MINLSMPSPMKFCLLMVMLLPIRLGLAQTTPSLSLDSCYALAKQHYPLVKQTALIEQSKVYSIENASKSYWPQVSINGQATYQSEVTSLPITLPNINVPTPSKDQYKLYGEINQPLTDLFTVKQQKSLIEANAMIELQKVEVELSKLKERINQLFFGILLIDAQKEQTLLLKKDLKAGMDKIKAAIANGTSFKSNENILKAEELKADQRLIELQSNRKGFIDMLSLFINKPLSESVVLEMPWSQPVLEQINRPELKLYEFQKRAFDVQQSLINAKTRPKFNLFLQGGYGRPALNALSNEFNTYYIGGLRLNWNLSSFYTSGKEKKQLELSKTIQDTQKETFLFNTKLSLLQQSNEMKKYVALLDNDNQIIALRQEIKVTAMAQLENGTITSNDYLTYLNAEDQAKQTQILHQIQYLLAQCNYQTTSGN